MEKTKTLSQWLNIKYIVPVFIIVAVFLLAGCGGGGSTTGSSSTPTATTGSTAATPTTGTGLTPTVTTSGTCNLVTTAQASTILGGTVQARASSATIGTMTANVCFYTSTQKDGATIVVGSTTDATTARAAFTQLQQQTKITSGSQYQDVTGLGDAAFTDGKVLYVLKGKTLMTVTVTGSSNPAKVLPEEKQFAQDALPNVS